MPIKVEIEGQGVVAEFPGGTPDDLIDKAIKRDFFQPIKLEKRLPVVEDFLQKQTEKSRADIEKFLKVGEPVHGKGLIGQKILEGTGKFVAQLPQATYDIAKAGVIAGATKDVEPLLETAGGFAMGVAESVLNPVETFLKKPEQTIGTALLFTGLKSPAVRGRIAKIVEPINNFWKTKVAEPIAGKLDKLVPDAVKDWLYRGRTARDPELNEIIRRGQATRQELLGKLKTTIETTKKLQESIPVKGQFAREMRTRQLLAPITTEPGGLPTKQVPKAGITTRPELQKMAEAVQDFQAELGAKAVETGLLEPESFLRHSQAYLHRAYNDYLIRNPIRKILPFKRTTVRGQTFRQRAQNLVEQEQTRLQKTVDALYDNVSFLENKIKLGIEKNVSRLESALKKHKREVRLYERTILKEPLLKESLRTSPAFLRALRRNIRTIEESFKQRPEPGKQELLNDLRNIETRVMKKLPITGELDKVFSDPRVRSLVEEGRKIQSIEQLVDELKSTDISQIPDPVIRNIKKEIHVLEKMKESAGLRIDIPFDQQLKMGLVSPVQQLALGGIKTVNDIASLQIMRDILGNPKYTSIEFRKGWQELKKPQGMKTELWKEITGKKGDQSVWIEPETYADAFDFVRQKSDLRKSYDTFRAFIQKHLTVKNPFFIPVNAIGNISIVDAGGGSMARYLKNLTPASRNDVGYLRAVEALRKEGIAYEVIPEVEISQFMPELKQGQPILQQAILWMDKVTDIPLRGKGQVRFNTKIDFDAKVEVYRSQIEKGLSHKEAIAHTERFTPNPRNIPKWAQVARTIGVPSLFVSFPVEMVKLMKNYAKERPTKLLKWIALPLILKEIMIEEQQISDEELDALEKQRPTWRRYLGGMGLTFPIRREDGSLEEIDVSNFFPWTSVFQLPFGFRGVASNPIAEFAFETATGRQLDTGREIRKPGERGLLMKVQRYSDEFASKFPQYRLPEATWEYLTKQAGASGEVREPIELFSLFSPVKFSPISNADVDLKLMIIKSQIQDKISGIRKTEFSYERNQISRAVADTRIENLKREISELELEAKQTELIRPKKAEL